MKTKFKIVPFLVVIFLALFVIGCAPKRVHKTVEVKEKKAAQKPLTRLQPLKAPAVDKPSLTLVQMEQKGTRAKTRTIVRRSRSSSIPKAVTPPTPAVVVPAIPVEEKIEISTQYQARLKPGWEANGLKYVSIDGLRYSREEIMAYSRSGGSSPFSLHENGVLLVNLNKSFKLELAFYPPNTAGHETFQEFKLHVFNKKGKIVHKEYVNKRLQVYSIEK